MTGRVTVYSYSTVGQPVTSTTSSFGVNTYAKDSVRAESTDMVYPVPEDGYLPAAGGCLPIGTLDSPLSPINAARHSTWNSC